MRKVIFIILSFVVVLFLGCVQKECTINEDCVPPLPLVGAKYLCENNKCVQKPFGNPASEKCMGDGGRLEMVNEADGQKGMCIFDDSSVCEEWAYFKGECKKGDCMMKCGAIGTRSEGWYDCKGKLVYWDKCSEEVLK